MHTFQRVQLEHPMVRWHHRGYSAFGGKWLLVQIVIRIGSWFPKRFSKWLPPIVQLMYRNFPPEIFIVFVFQVFSIFKICFLFKTTCNQLKYDKLVIYLNNCFKGIGNAIVHDCINTHCNAVSCKHLLRWHIE